MNRVDEACDFDSVPAPSAPMPPAQALEREQVYLGIDPGLDGFVARVDSAGRFTSSAHVPLIADGSYDVRGMFELLKQWTRFTRLAVIEAQQAFPEQGLSSTFSTGFGYGLWTMALVASGIPFEVVRPQKWKKAMGIMPAAGLKGNERTKEAKRLAVEKTSALFPGVDLRENERCRVSHAGKCEAMLMAEYSRRVHSGALA